MMIVEIAAGVIILVLVLIMSNGSARRNLLNFAARNRDALDTLSATVIAIFTVVLAVSTILLWQSGEKQIGATKEVARASQASADAAQASADAAKNANNILQETFTAAQRPWLSAAVTIGPKGLYYDKDGVNVQLLFSLRNTGNTPAASVVVDGTMRIGALGRGRLDEQEDLCQKNKRIPNQNSLGSTVFPGESIVMDITYQFQNKDDKDWLKKLPTITPNFIGCVNYLYTFGDPAFHQSRFIYELFSVDPGGAQHFIKVSDGDEAPDALALSPWYQAGSFQAN